ncbi:ABC transporter ATP-binding protein [Streptomyces sp. NPDC020845]|uniref:ABC transporter ATP-binding protein n=1 Tax=Streptomyces sp. NPDC020845 TaxID=3365096 RepID=UPI00378E4264
MASSSPADTTSADAATTPDRPADRAGERLLRGALRHSAGRVVAVFWLTTAAAAVGLALPAVLGRTLDVLLADPHGAEARRWVLTSAGLTCLLVVLDALDSLLTGTANARSIAWLRRRLLRHTLSAGPRAGRRTAAGDLVTRLVGNAAQAGTAPTALASALAAVVTPVGGLVALALIDPWLALAFLLGLPLLAVLLRSFVRDTTDSVARYQHSQGEIAGRLVEALGGARTIAAAGTGGRERARVLAPLPELSRQGHRMWRVQGRSAAWAAAIVPLLQIAVVAVAGLRLTAGELSVGSLLAAARYAVLATGIGMLVGHLNGLVRSRTAARRFAPVLAEPATAYGTRSLPPGDGTLELRGVRAARGGREVLHGVDLVVPGGRCVAVVGRSGSGKSTLAAIAGRLADPDGGEVLLDGVPLPELTHGALRRAIGYAFERPALLGGTVGGTIALGPAPPPPGRVVEAARAACADDFVRLLPDGYDTPVADAPLSGGETQRLGLARAFVHEGRVLILDDATSSLDTVTELRVTRALSGRLLGARPRTRVIVAHRAATAARADLVVWLEDGRVRAAGRHAELWALDGYRAVFAAPDVSDGPDVPGGLDVPDGLNVLDVPDAFDEPNGSEVPQPDGGVQGG